MLLENIFYIDEKFSNYTPFLELISLEPNEVIMGDKKKDRIVDVRARRMDDGKAKFQCSMDDTHYCPHTGFAAFTG